MRGMLNSLFGHVWGTFASVQEARKFVRLAWIFAFTIGVYWIINPTKDVVFVHTVGRDYLAYAKIFSILFLIPLLFAYSKLVDLYPRHRAFYILCGMYALISCVFGLCMVHPLIGLSNTDLNVYRSLGWLWYAFVESFGSIIVASFWSFASDVSTPESAKKGFSIIAFGAQVGGVLGPLMFYRAAQQWGAAPFAFIGAIGIACIGLAVVYFMRVTPASELVGFHKAPEKTVHKRQVGFFEGISLIFSHTYLLGIVGIVVLYETVFVIIEFHLKTLASQVYTNQFQLNGFLFKYAIYANGIALISLIFGAGAIGRRLGLQKTLLLLPLLVLCGIGILSYSFTLPTVLAVFVGIKGLNYALNQPAKEQLYIPTTRESKYKAKAWIDVFGSRMAKSVGSSVHILRPMLESYFIMVSSLISCGLVLIWALLAVSVGKAHARAVEREEEIC